MERQHLEQIVNDMAQGKAGPSTGIGFHPEGVTGAGKKIEDEADGIAYRIGDGGPGEAKHGQIDGILQQCSQHADDAETEQFAEFPTLTVV